MHYREELIFMRQVPNFGKGSIGGGKVRPKVTSVEGWRLRDEPSCQKVVKAFPQATCQGKIVAPGHCFSRSTYV
jgi:hypothetical protein